MVQSLVFMAWLLVGHPSLYRAVAVAKSNGEMPPSNSLLSFIRLLQETDNITTPAVYLRHRVASSLLAGHACFILAL